MGCFPLLASVLGNRYGVRIQIGGEEAKTDGKVVYLPAMPAQLDSDTLEAARGYLDHEAAHIRHTDFEKLRKAHLDRLEAWLFNALEDWRVEKRLAETFPGCEHNFRKLIIRIFGQATETGHKSPVSVILNYILLTVRSWAVKEITERKIKTGEAVYALFPDLKIEIDDLLSEIGVLNTASADMIAYARKLAEVIRRHRAEDQKYKKSGGSESASKEGPSGRNASVQTTDGSFNEELPDDAPMNLGDILSDEINSHGISDKKDALCVARIGRKTIAQFPHDEKIEALRSSVSMRHRLSGLLLAKIDSKGWLGRKGRLDTHDLHRICVGNTRLFRKSVDKQGLSTAIHILLDCSTSMYGESMSMARKACLAIVSALSGIKGINLALTAFPAEDGENTVYPVFRHGHKAIAMPALCARGETPLGPAIWWVLTDMLPLQENRKIVFIITDGAPTSVKAAKTAIGQCLKFGIELMGVGIRSQAIDHLLGDKGRTIWKLEELGPAIFELLGNALVTGGTNDFS